MTKRILLATVIFGMCSCQKEVTNEQPTTVPPKVVYDSLLIYQVNNSGSNKAIFSKSLKTGDSLMLAANATMPFVSNQRMVYIKSGKTIGYARLNGITKSLIDLEAPAYPCLSLDARLISVVDKVGSEYQLLVLDTLGNKRVLFTTTREISQPEFSYDGNFIYFANKDETNSSIYKISTAGGEPYAFVSAPSSIEFASIAATSDRIYFLQNKEAGGKISSEITSVTTEGTGFTQHTNFSSNWSVPGVKIDQLRDINNSTLVFTSDYNNTNKDIYFAKTDNINNHIRVTFSDTYESYPSLVPDFVKDY